MPEEQLILVDERNRAIGTAGKTAAHRRDLLHRAFSIFVVDASARIVLQQRSRKKYHSGGLWANSCCGHPRPGERTLAAAHRRLREELGIDSDLSFAFFARYRSALDHGMHENELVYVYFGRLESPLDPDPAEVAATDLSSCAEITRRIEQRPSDFAVWFQHYFRKHGDEIAVWAERAARPSRPR
ncbi:MAG: isopentenyl-diphosphate Delta-isomerase [Hyphomicrobiales bacterium]|nr:isopentenyl-diphosphate Delta-isomerase [Hyphomicrobiales bacterium]